MWSDLCVLIPALSSWMFSWVLLNLLPLSHSTTMNVLVHALVWLVSSLTISKVGFLCTCKVLPLKCPAPNNSFLHQGFSLP